MLGGCSYWDFYIAKSKDVNSRPSKGMRVRAGKKGTAPPFRLHLKKQINF
jgi:hypothetical protein